MAAGASMGTLMHVASAVVIAVAIK
jgi:hypothetical protein